MARLIPKKKAVAKKERQDEIATLISPKEQRKFERRADNYLIDLEEKAGERYEWALALSKLQDEETQVAINRMVMTMARMAGNPVFVFEGTTLSNSTERLKKIQYYNHLWIAMRLLVACAEWEIRIGNFKAPKGKCIRCGKSA